MFKIGVFMKMKNYLLGSVLVVMVACTPTMRATRVSVDKGDALAANITDKWLKKDTELAIKSIVDGMETHKGLQRYLAKFEARGKTPKLFISEVNNQTSEAYFPIGDLNDELLNYLSENGEFILVDAAARDKILREITYQNDGMVDPTQAKSIGKQSGADLLIFGDVRMNPETLKGKTIKEYSVNLRMTDLQTGEEIWRGRYNGSKYSVRKNLGW
jgi:uncharacterized protein (TIGR02722 family)